MIALPSLPLLVYIVINFSDVFVDSLRVRAAAALGLILLFASAVQKIHLHRLLGE
jgi:hypothetical protein